MNLRNKRATFLEKRAIRNLHIPSTTKCSLAAKQVLLNFNQEFGQFSLQKRQSRAKTANWWTSLTWKLLPSWTTFLFSIYIYINLLTRICWCIYAFTSVYIYIYAYISAHSNMDIFLNSCIIHPNEKVSLRSLYVRLLTTIWQIICILSATEKSLLASTAALSLVTDS